MFYDASKKFHDKLAISNFLSHSNPPVKKFDQIYYLGVIVILILFFVKLKTGHKLCFYCSFIQQGLMQTPCPLVVQSSTIKEGRPEL